MLTEVSMALGVLENQSKISLRSAAEFLLSKCLMS